MTVAVKSEPVVGQDTPTLGLAGASLAGAAYILLGVIVFYYLVPWLWPAQPDGTRDLYQKSAMLGVMVAGAIGLTVLWPMLFKPQPGLRGGVAVAIGLVLIGLVAFYIVGALVGSLFKPSETAGTACAFVTGAFWLWLMYRWFQKERFQERVLEFEEQGWFATKPYKKGQGLRARRGTVLGIIGIVGSGLWVYSSHKNFFSSPQWTVNMPFNIPHDVVLLWLPSFSLSVLIGAGTIWFAYRLVNYPKFADFLIATEAEMSKVTWTSQRHLIRDTVVVLVTVFLMTVFLLSMDFIWSFLLTQLGVLQK